MVNPVGLLLGQHVHGHWLDAICNHVAGQVGKAGLGPDPQVMAVRCLVDHHTVPSLQRHAACGQWGGRNWRRASGG